MFINEFNFHLPKNLIAQSPTSPRDHAKLLIYRKEDKSVSLYHFYDLPKLLKAGDVLVFNNTKVFPARLNMNIDGVSSEILFLEQISGVWKCMVKPGKRMKVGKELDYYGLFMKVVSIDEDGYRFISVNLSGKDFMDFLWRYGQMPVPPYIKGNDYKNEDYNTIYSKKTGSVAAPTAGLHFTKQLINRLISAGIDVEYITLHVGLGTFLPIKAEDVNSHKMHEERYSIDRGTAARLNMYKSQKRRIFAVGTTSVRTLEDNYGKNRAFMTGDFKTNIFIKPGYKWQSIDGIITNFHLPKSTLVMLVAAMVGRDETIKVYEIAKKSGLKFYSFGDGMMVI